MNEEKNEPVNPPNFEGEEMHMPEGESSKASYTPATSSNLISAPILILMVVLLLLVLGGMYYWFTKLEQETANSVVIPTTNQMTEEGVNDEDLNSMPPTSDSDEISDIEADLSATEFESLDAELEAIDSELEAEVESE